MTVRIKAFEICAAKILGSLYAEFPSRAIILEPEEYIQELDFPAGLSEKEKSSIFLETLLWLIREGYLADTSKFPGAQVALTTKGFDALNKPITDNITGEKTTGQRLRDLFSNTGAEAGKAFISETASEIVQSMIKSWG